MTRTASRADAPTSRRICATSLMIMAALAAAAGCSTKAPGNGNAGGSAGGDGVKVGRGVSGDVITLGVLTDLSGVFSANGKDMTQSQQLYWEQQNAAGGICGKYKVRLKVSDHANNVQNAVQLYDGMRSEVLAIQQTVGSPVTIALGDQMKADSMVNIPLAFATSLTENPQNAIVGATYDIEMINVLGYLYEQGLIKDGDKIGHIYFTGEYGANGLAGSKYFASQHGMTVEEAQINSTDTDMTAQITRFKASGVNALALTAAPQAASSAAVAAQQVGLDVPIAANNPNFSPGMLAGPAAAALREHFYFATPVPTFDQAQQLLTDYTAKFEVDGALQPALTVIYGHADAVVMKQILERACASKDLTPEGVTTAKQSLTNPDTQGLTVPLDFTVAAGQSPSRQTYILRPADQPGGARAVTTAVAAADVKDYQPAG